jgi:hypothetical protein
LETLGQHLERPLWRLRNKSGLGQRRLVLICCNIATKATFRTCCHLFASFCSCCSSFYCFFSSCLSLGVGWRCGKSKLCCAFVSVFGRREFSNPSCPKAAVVDRDTSKGVSSYSSSFRMATASSIFSSVSPSSSSSSSPSRSTSCQHKPVIYLEKRTTPQGPGDINQLFHRHAAQSRAFE